VNRKFKNITISDNFIGFILTVNSCGVGGLCVEGDDYKKVVNFLRKKVHPSENILATPLTFGDLA